MTAGLGPVLVNLLMLAAGLGLLYALGIPERSPLGALAAAGLGYLSGVAAVLLAGIALLTVGVPFTLVTFVAVALAVALAGAFVAIKRSPAISETDGEREGGDGEAGDARPAEGEPAAAEAPAPAPAALGRLQGWLPSGRSADRGALAVFVAVLIPYAVIGYLRAAASPLAAWDAWSIWTRKAVALAQFGELRTDFFANEAYRFMSPDYPILLPLFEAVHLRAMGGVDAQALTAELWIVLVAFVWALGFVASRLTRPLVWVPIVLAAALAPGVYNQLLTAYADVPMGLFLALGVLLLGLWLARGGESELALAALLLAGAASIKNEGLMAAAAVLALAAVVLGVERRYFLLGRLGVAVAGFAALILPWRVWTAVQGVEAVNIPVAQGLDPGYLAGRTERVAPSLNALLGELADQRAWLYIVPLALAAAIVCIATRTAGRIAAFYLSSIVAVVALLTWAYWVNPFGLDWQLQSSVGRVVSAVVFVSLAALVQLAGRLEERGAGRADRLGGAQ